MEPVEVHGGRYPRSGNLSAGFRGCRLGPASGSAWLGAAVVGRGYAWLDTGTHQSLQQAASYIETLESRPGLRVVCPEEIAFRHGWISRNEPLALAEPWAKSGYGEYLRMVARTHSAT